GWEKTTALLGPVKELGFKLEGLERSYTRQLADTRERCRAAESELADAKRRLAETKNELAEAAATRDRLRGMLSFDGRRAPPGAAASQAPDDNTINRLLSDDGRADAEARERRDTPRLGGQERSEERRVGKEWR